MSRLHYKLREVHLEKGTAISVAVFSLLISLLLVQMSKACSAGLTVSEKVLSVLNDVMNLKPRLIASEACHRLALSEGQKEN